MRLAMLMAAPCWVTFFEPVQHLDAVGHFCGSSSTRVTCYKLSQPSARLQHHRAVMTLLCLARTVLLLLPLLQVHTLMSRLTLDLSS
jgi:hypothetical protein